MYFIFLWRIFGTVFFAELFNQLTLKGFWELAIFLRSTSYLQTLSRPIPNLCIVYWFLFDSFRPGFACVILNVIQLYKLRALQLKVTNQWPDPPLQDFLKQSRTYGSVHQVLEWSSSPSSHSLVVLNPVLASFFLTRCNKTPSKKFYFYPPELFLRS